MHLIPVKSLLQLHFSQPQAYLGYEWKNEEKAELSVRPVSDDIFARRAL